jgi:hypothetical protein
MYAQLDSKVMYKRSKKKGRLPKFYEFWGEEVHCIKDPQKRKLECLNIIISWIP